MLKILPQDLLCELGLIDLMYDYIRLIDPKRKEVIVSQGMKSQSISKHESCFNIFNKDKSCINCTSMRAISCKKSLVKLELFNSKVFLITSVPVEIEGSMYVIETLKDITSDGIIDILGKETVEIKHIVEQRNIFVVRDAFNRIFNENFIRSQLPYDITIAQREARNLALFVISIKNMRKINDLFGVITGDKIIHEYSKILKVYIKRNENWVARLSGTDFVIAIYDIDKEEVYQIAKRINDKLENYAFQDIPRNFKIENSVGYHLINDYNITSEELLLKASKNQYRSSLATSNETLEDLTSVQLDKFLFTTREIEVAHFLLEGKSNNEISNHLYISLSTVKKHIRNIYKKTNVTSRAEFIVKIKQGNSHVFG